MERYFIYKLTCLPNGKIYIGASKDPLTRYKQHRYSARRGDNRLLYHAIRKHGILSFHMDVIYGSVNKDHVFNEMEPYFIKLFESDNLENGYNLSPGRE